jgi:TPR repeat protein
MNFEKILKLAFDRYKCNDPKNSNVQYMIGNIYYEGQEVKQDYKEALQYFQKSADK